MKNLELKIKLNSFDEVKRNLESNDIKLKNTLNQKDIYFKSDKGRLKIRIVNGIQELIFYNRNEIAGERFSDYEILNLKSSEAEKFFRKIFEVETIIKKKRELYIYKNTRIHLDQVEGLGIFLELETVVNSTENKARTEFEEVVNKLKLDVSNQILKSYKDLCLEKNDIN